jgi:hypothetical protein
MDLYRGPSLLRFLSRGLAATMVCLDGFHERLALDGISLQRVRGNDRPISNPINSTVTRTALPKTRGGSVLLYQISRSR